MTDISHPILLSLVGEQTIPLVQFIRALPPAAEYWFVETKRTRELQCVTNIAKACGIAENKIKTVLVTPEALSFEPPANWILPADTLLYLNLTSGTKPMMLSVYRQYEAMPQSRCYYIPIGATKAEAVQGGWPAWLLPQLNLETYLRALGFAYTFTKPDAGLQKKAVSLFKEVCRQGNSESVPQIKQSKQPGTQHYNRVWLSGEWWEDFLYASFKRDLDLEADCIAQGVRLEHCLSESTTDSDNELDVVFVYNSRLYAVEGKVYSGIATGDRITKPVYKLGTIIKTMGLQASGVVALCANITASKDQMDRIDYLKRISGVRDFWTLKEFQKEKDFKKLLSK